jgi:hypothetical protein
VPVGVVDTYEKLRSRTSELYPLWFPGPSFNVSLPSTVTWRVRFGKIWSAKGCRRLVMRFRNSSSSRLRSRASATVATALATSWKVGIVRLRAIFFDPFKWVSHLPRILNKITSHKLRLPLLTLAEGSIVQNPDIVQSRIDGLGFLPAAVADRTVSTCLPRPQQRKLASGI